VKLLLKRSPLLILIISLPFFTFAPPRTIAQIIPDHTLPDRSVVPADCTRCEITGGTQRGRNLFHSFEQFSVSRNGEAFFNNGLDVRNIFSRVTGNSISTIDGVIRANGNTNVFLINPNGILLSANASLDIGGSFIATTGDRILFSDGLVWHTTDTQPSPLLSINVPVGLQLGSDPGEIRVQSSRLQGAAGRTLALLGGRLTLLGAEIRAPQGRIELGSGVNGLIGLNPVDQGWAFDYSGISSFRNVNLSNQSVVDASGNRGGNIQLQGQQIRLIEGSQIRLVGRSNEQTGNVLIRASDRVELVGNNARSTITGLFNEVRGSATGAGSTLTVETRQLIVRNGAQVSTNTLGSGRGSNLNILARESVDLIGSSSNRLVDQGQPRPSGLFTTVVEPTGDRAALIAATGQGGILTLQTRRLTVREGAQISTSTFSQGNAGNLRITASEAIDLSGTVPGTNIPTAIFANVAETAIATGNGGTVAIQTPQLTVRNGAQIGTTAQNSGRGGTLTIRANSIQLTGTSPLAQFRGEGRSGLFVSAEPALADGSVTTADAGTLNVTANELLVENGALISADNFGTGRGANVVLNVDRLQIHNGGQIGASSLLERNFRDRQRGPGGTLTINAAEAVEITGTGRIGSQTVNSGIFTLAEGTGAAGDIRLQSPNLLLAQQALISAETASTQGGNISLQVRDELLLEGNSRISTTAGTQQAGGNGGNIYINAQFIVATPNENNDITANAFTGSGGEVRVTVQSLFGLTSRDRSALQDLLEPDDPLDPVRLPSSDITAISQANPNLNGRVVFNTPDVDPAQGLVELPSNVIDASNLIAQGCGAANTAQELGEFVITGRGGLPPSPLETLDREHVSSSWVRLPDATDHATSTSEIAVATTGSPALTEAQSWVVKADGTVQLLALPGHRGYLLSRTSCPASE
jgi:filamentous hemagglutinin family protein